MCIAHGFYFSSIALVHWHNANAFLVGPLAMHWLLNTCQRVLQSKMLNWSRSLPVFKIFSFFQIVSVQRLFDVFFVIQLIVERKHDEKFELLLIDFPVQPRFTANHVSIFPIELFPQTYGKPYLSFK